MTYYKVQHICNPEIYRIAFTFKQAIDLRAKMGFNEFEIRMIDRNELKTCAIDIRTIYNRC
jgi:hypothetical protein